MESSTTSRRTNSDAVNKHEIYFCYIAFMNTVEDVKQLLINN